MEITITFRGFDHSEVLDKHIREQLKKIENLLANERSPITMEFLVTLHPTHGHNEVNARVHTPHFHCKASHEGKDIYVEINEVCDRLYKQLRDRKERLVDRRKQGCDGECRAGVWKEIESMDGDAFENFEKIEGDLSDPKNLEKKKK